VPLAEWRGLVGLDVGAATERRLDRPRVGGCDCTANSDHSATVSAPNTRKFARIMQLVPRTEVRIGIHRLWTIIVTAPPLLTMGRRADRDAQMTPFRTFAGRGYLGRRERAYVTP